LTAAVLFIAAVNYFRETQMKLRMVALFSFFALMLSGCGYNQVQINDEQVKSAWSEVLNPESSGSQGGSQDYRSRYPA
jgi:hypothetical protein